MKISIKSSAVLSALILGLLLAIFPPSFLAPAAGRAASFAFVIIAFWATGFIPEYLTALIFFTGAMLFDIAPPGVIFSGFSSGALWLIFGGLIFSSALSGLLMPSALGRVVLLVPIAMTIADQFGLQRGS